MIPHADDGTTTTLTTGAGCNQTSRETLPVGGGTMKSNILTVSLSYEESVRLASTLALTLEWLVLVLAPLQHQWMRPARARWARRTAALLQRRAIELRAVAGDTQEDHPTAAVPVGQLREALHLAERTVRHLRPSPAARSLAWARDRSIRRQVAQGARERSSAHPASPADAVLAQLASMHALLWPQTVAQRSPKPRRLRRKKAITVATQLAARPLMAASRALRP